MIVAPPTLRRAGLVRLLVVVAALVGITLIQNAHCPAMAMGMPMSAAAGMNAGECAVVSAGEVPDGHGYDHGHPSEKDAATHATATVGLGSAVDESGSMLPAGIAMACLAVFLALIVALAVPRRIERAFVFLRSPLRTGVRPRTAPPRPPDLSELCVLRT